MAISVFSGLELVLLCQLMASPIVTFYSSTGWRSLPIERRLSDADLVVWAKAMSIQNVTAANETQSIGYLLLHITVWLSPVFARRILSAALPK